LHDVTDRDPSTGFVQGMAVFEPYILGMLANHDKGMPLEQVHNMLKMFVANPPYVRTTDQLAAGLTRLVAQEKLILDAGLYRRRP
jgi:anaphase-promoting complex subunit 2